MVVVSSQTRADSSLGRGNHEFENNVIDNLDDAGSATDIIVGTRREKSDRSLGDSEKAAHETESNGRLI